MKMLSRAPSTLMILGIVLGLSGVFGLSTPVARAATTPDLGDAESFAVLADTYTNTAAGTIIDGDLGYTTPPATDPVVTGSTEDETALYFSAGADQGSALTDLSTQPCTAIGAIITLDSYDVDGPGGVAPGTFPPGCYSSTGAMNVTLSTTVTLDATAVGGVGDTWIFRPGGALNTGADAIIDLVNGADVCDVFWTPTGLTTLGADNTFEGTVIDDAGVTIGGATEWTGRALAFGGTVTTGTDVTITTPTCAAPPVPGGGGGVTTYTGSINVVKVVVNDNGQTSDLEDFDLFIDGNPITSGETNAFSFLNNAVPYTISETNNEDYVLSFSGDCDEDGLVYLDPAENAFCVMTNNDIGAAIVVPPVPPLIDVVKVPSPQALPDGPGDVVYTYALRNVGTVAMSDITMIDDSCSPAYVSGDADNDDMLDVTETWSYRCTETLTATHTNTVVATGWANGLSVSDIAIATVIVGEPIIPPLIHVTKVPSPLTLVAGGGMVTYTERITNPGTVPLEDVTLVDDKCSVSYVSGDVNNNTLLDVTETWTYTCQSNLTATTTNTAIATGSANDLTVRDIAIATVVVATAVPALPVTGIAPAQGVQWIALIGILSIALALYGATKKRNA